MMEYNEGTNSTGGTSPAVWDNYQFSDSTNSHLTYADPWANEANNLSPIILNSNPGDEVLGNAMNCIFDVNGYAGTALNDSAAANFVFSSDPVNFDIHNNIDETQHYSLMSPQLVDVFKWPMIEYIWSPNILPGNEVVQTAATINGTHMQDQWNQATMPLQDFNNDTSEFCNMWRNTTKPTFPENHLRMQVQANTLIQKEHNTSDATTQTELTLPPSYFHSPLNGHGASDAITPWQQSGNLDDGPCKENNVAKLYSTHRNKTEELAANGLLCSSPEGYTSGKLQLCPDNIDHILGGQVENTFQISTPKSPFPKEVPLLETSPSPIEAPRWKYQSRMQSLSSFRETPYNYDSSSNLSSSLLSFSSLDEYFYPKSAVFEQHAISNETPVRKSPRNRQGNRPKYTQCSFCRSNGESPKQYKSHILKDSSGKLTCPVLRAYRCPICQKTGDEAHTLTHCPRNPDKVPVARLLNQTPRNAAGKLRRPYKNNWEKKLFEAF